MMDIARAKEIVAALAEGVDPTTGEVLPEDSVYNKGDVVRALFTLLKACEHNKTKGQKTKKEPDEYDVVLYNRLKEIRNQLAEEKGILPYRIFPNYPLMHMAAHKPITKEDFQKIHGVGKYTTKQYGKIFIAEIQAYLAEDNK